MSPEFDEEKDSRDSRLSDGTSSGVLDVPDNVHWVDPGPFFARPPTKAARVGDTYGPTSTKVTHTFNGEFWEPLEKEEA